MYRVKLDFKNEQNKLETIRYDNFYVALPTTKTEKNLAIAQAFPSILGTDFLTINKLSLHFTPNKDITYFERK